MPKIGELIRGLLFPKKCWQKYCILLKDRATDLIIQISKDGITVLLVDQNVKQALQLSQRAYVLENGMICLEGTSEEVLNNPEVKKAYFRLVIISILIGAYLKGE